MEEALKVANDDDEQKRDQIIDTVQQRQRPFILLMHLYIFFGFILSFYLNDCCSRVFI